MRNLDKNKPLIFIDLDGVLADLFGYAAEQHAVESYKYIDAIQWEQFLSNNNAEELFANLPVFPIANQIVEMVVEIAGEYRILSSPLTYDKARSIQGKKQWIAKNIQIPAVEHIFETEKHKYAFQTRGIPNILIDDFGKNIAMWNRHGGRGIKHRSDQNTLEELRTKLTAAFNK